MSGDGSNRATYRVAFKIVAAVGDFLELRSRVGHGRIGRLRKVTISKPSNPAIVTLIKRASWGTGGTGTASGEVDLSVPLDSSDRAATLEVQGYDAAPTTGASLGTLTPPFTLGVGEVADFVMGDAGGKAGTIRPGESIAVATSVAATISGILEWTEEDS